MQLVVIFIFGSVILGGGAMLAPAWNTHHPRIGLAAALALGLILGGAIFWAMLFGWNTLVIDYLLFALVTAIFLGGTLSYGQKRAEAKGETLMDTDQGWPGPEDLIFFALIALVFILPILLIPVPLDTDAQGFGYLGLMARMGGGFDTLAPWHPEITYLYAPGFTLLIAYLSQQLNLGMHTVQMGVGAVLAFMLVWLAYDLGGEIRDKRLGRAMALATAGGLGLFSAYMDSHYTTLLGMVFGLAFFTFALRYQRDGTWPDAVAAGLMLGACVLSHPDTTIIIGLGYVPWLGTMWLGNPRPTLRRWLVMLMGIPLVALVGIAPWLVNIRDLLGGDIVSPFSIDPAYWQIMLVYHLPIVAFVIVGAVVGLRARGQMPILAVGWLVLVLEFSSVGLLERLFPWLVAPVVRYDYPFSIAWHGPIIPYTILGGIGLLWVWERWLAARLESLLKRRFYILATGLVIIALAGIIFNREILVISKGKVGFFGAFSSHADVRAMEWLRQNTPDDAFILNFPGPQEGDWAPVISERQSVYYRPQPFFRGDEASMALQEQMRLFWLNPADPAHADLLAEAGVDYVIVPQVVVNPASIETMYRWRAPFTEAVDMQSAVADAPYLELVFEDSGAQVYQFSG